jgi:hypothetical protein
MKSAARERYRTLELFWAISEMGVAEKSVALLIAHDRCDSSKVCEE